MSIESTEIITQEVLENLIIRALEEDIHSGDVTTEAIIEKDANAEAIWVTKDEGIIAGLGSAALVFEKLDSGVAWQSLAEDGDYVQEGTKVASMSGDGRTILTAERTALNIAQRMSGIATKTRQYVDKISEFPAQILDTRKTVPGLRLLDKYAVKTGGGQNHRMGLYDLALIKDNHIEAAGSITDAVQKVRSYNQDITIEVETTTLQQVDEALSTEADMIMLDNMNLKMMKEAVQQIGSRAKTEASGNVTLSTVRDIAATGVDYISVGALTHSVQAFDISQRLV